MSVCQCDGACGECPSILRKIFVDCRRGVIWVKPLCSRTPRYSSSIDPAGEFITDWIFPIPILVCEACHIRLISTLEYVSLGPDLDAILADEEERRMRWFGLRG